VCCNALQSYHYTLYAPYAVICIHDNIIQHRQHYLFVVCFVQCVAAFCSVLQSYCCTVALYALVWINNNIQKHRKQHPTNILSPFEQRKFFHNIKPHRKFQQLKKNDNTEQHRHFEDKGHLKADTPFNNTAKISCPWWRLLWLLKKVVWYPYCGSICLSPAGFGVLVLFTSSRLFLSQVHVHSSLWGGYNE